ncbi:diadenylate cyclase CdaA [Desulfovibrio inopinatus]|uniref:diadenylate cyclase CdaA n=1 Tax=Desulfovibrio inopinatus TaxID=102109 RepID=UPI0003FF1DBB|nr:diadenylate cyclase CdaA [Desulfovibrio inopinatus]
MLQWLTTLDIGWREALDVFLVATIFYRLLLLIKGTRAVSIIYGMVLLLVLYYLSGTFGLYTLHWLLTNFLGSFILVIVIIFQADIRKGLSQMGATRLIFMQKKTLPSEEIVQELVLTLFHLAKTRTGALIVLERSVPLGDVMAKGTELIAPIKKEILLSVFNTAAPLHDGAVVVKGDRIVAVSCILPLATGLNMDPNWGTRHRAALGITEETDAAALVVSEERGSVTVAVNGRLSSPMNESQLKQSLFELWVGQS